MLPLQRLNHRAPLTESTSPAHEHTPLLVPFSSASVPPPSSPSPWEPLLPIAKQFQEEGWRHKFICRGPEGVIRLGSILKILGRAQENFPCPFLMPIDRRAPLLFPCGSPNRHSPALGLASKEKTAMICAEMYLPPAVWAPFVLRTSCVFLSRPSISCRKNFLGREATRDGV